jgi:adenylosuccinate lyase
MKCSGATGNYTVITPEIEKRVAEKLHLIPENHSTQIIPRDRIAKLVSIGALYASALERFCVEIRGLSRSEVREVSEGFGNKQKGSSTMPHKSNPVSCENLTGIARIMRSHLSVALENCITWHERDISHSSCERLFLPDHLTLWSYSLSRLAKTIDGLVIHKETMRKRVEESNTKFTSLWLHELILKTGAPRDEIYDHIQSVTRTGNVKSWDIRDHFRSMYGVILSHPSYEELLEKYRKEYKKVAERFVIPRA